MTGQISTLPIRDGNGNLANVRVWDESGADTGPFSFLSTLGDDGAKLARKEDDASASGDPGIVALIKRSDTPGNTSGTDGDYEPIQGSAGRVWASAKIDTALPAGSNKIGSVDITDISAGEYETVAASANDQAIGATGASGDYLAGVLIVPATTSPGAVSIKDGGGSAITIFTGGASSVSNLVPFFVPLGIKSGSGAWKVTTGSNVSALAVGNFT